MNVGFYLCLPAIVGTWIWDASNVHSPESAQRSVEVYRDLNFSDEQIIETLGEDIWNLATREPGSSFWSQYPILSILTVAIGVCGLLAALWTLWRHEKLSQWLEDDLVLEVFAHVACVVFLLLGALWFASYQGERMRHEVANMVDDAWGFEDALEDAEVQAPADDDERRLATREPESSLWSRHPILRMLTVVAIGVFGLLAGLWILLAGLWILWIHREWCREKLSQWLESDSVVLSDGTAPPEEANEHGPPSDSGHEPVADKNTSTLPVSPSEKLSAPQDPLPQEEGPSDQSSNEKETPTSNSHDAEPAVPCTDQGEDWLVAGFFGLLALAVLTFYAWPFIPSFSAKIVWLVGLGVVAVIIVCLGVREMEREEEVKREEEEKRRQEEEKRRQEKEVRAHLVRHANRQTLAGTIVTAKGSNITGRRIENHLGAVFSKWQRIEFDSLPEEYYKPGYDELQMHELVELTLKYRARKLGANAIINLKMRTFRNGCEGSGDAVLATT